MRIRALVLLLSLCLWALPAHAELLTTAQEVAYVQDAINTVLERSDYRVVQDSIHLRTSYVHYLPAPYEFSAYEVTYRLQDCEGAISNGRLHLRVYAGCRNQIQNNTTRRFARGKTEICASLYRGSTVIDLEKGDLEGIHLFKGDMTP